MHRTNIFLFHISIVLVVTSFAFAVDFSETGIDIDWEYLKTCNRHFWATSDVNNDGIEEDVGVFLQWPGEGWWSDDIGYVMCIFDQNGKIIYGKEIARYAEVKDLVIKDMDKNGAKEVIIQCKYRKSDGRGSMVYVYKWNGSSFDKQSLNN